MVQGVDRAWDFQSQAERNLVDGQTCVSMMGTRQRNMRFGIATGLKRKEDNPWVKMPLNM